MYSLDKNFNVMFNSEPPCYSCRVYTVYYHKARNRFISKYKGGYASYSIQHAPLPKVYQRENGFSYNVLHKIISSSNNIMARSK